MVAKNLSSTCCFAETCGGSGAWKSGEVSNSYRYAGPYHSLAFFLSPNSWRCRSCILLVVLSLCWMKNILKHRIRLSVSSLQESLASSRRERGGLRNWKGAHAIIRHLGPRCLGGQIRVFLCVFLVWGRAKFRWLKEVFKGDGDDFDRFCFLLSTLLYYLIRKMFYSQYLHVFCWHLSLCFLSRDMFSWPVSDAFCSQLPNRWPGDKPKEFLQIVPRGLLPAMELDGKVMTESLDIMHLASRSWPVNNRRNMKGNMALGYSWQISIMTFSEETW